MSTDAATASARKTLSDFGYAFNEAGKMCQLDPATGEVTNQPFQFAISPESSQSENQKRYEEIGEVITDVVYELLETNGLHRLDFPSSPKGSKSSFIFSTKKELKDVSKLMVIIHGSGVVRAGQVSSSSSTHPNQLTATSLFSGHEA